MPSYKKHVLFSLIMALPFFPDVFYLSLAVIGASIIDFDHPVKKNNLMIMILFGILLCLILYLLNLPIILGVILIALALIFYISKHRGFMHSIFGIIIITIFLTIFIVGSYLLFIDFSQNLKIFLIVISLLLGVMVLNRNLLIPYSFLLLIGIILTKNLVLNPYYIFGALFLGGISHIILDLFTPSGVSILNPLSLKRYKKALGIILMIFWTLAVILITFYPFYHL